MSQDNGGRVHIPGTLLHQTRNVPKTLPSASTVETPSEGGSVAPSSGGLELRDVLPNIPEVIFAAAGWCSVRLEVIQVFDCPD
jgi:hypothetical protein